ncbi:MAG TPA: NUDIX hydrolase [Candidatus Saccharimonadales bacterium]|nr:NUDIX hydrolase [Candidatus Saccharimonadales bacterium]
MVEQKLIDHHIQKSILKVLSRKEFARYSEMRPEKTDSNLYAYHLNRLITSGYVDKSDKGYALSVKGLQYVEYTSSSMKINRQPKITTAILLKDNDGNVLLTKRLKQPYINYYGLPLGKTHSDKDNGILDSARRELYEKTGVKYRKLTHVGDTYLKIHMDKILISDILVHVFAATCKRRMSINESSLWVDKKELSKTHLIPGVIEIVNMVDSGERFFNEITV